ALAAVQWDGVDLVWFNGDMVSDPTAEKQIFRAAVDPSVELFATKIPLAYVRGNHETRGALARSFMDYFPMPGERYYFSLQHGGVHFLVLDAGEDKGDHNVEYSGLVDFEPYLKQETEWLKQEVQSKAFQEAKFRVVMMHIPPGEMMDPKFIREKWVMDNWGPLFNQGKVDVVLSGHTHVFAVVPPSEGKNAYPIIIGGTDTVIRGDVRGDQMTLVVTDNEGKTVLSSTGLKRK
ncbi:MAG TPA: metallophosphoesterase, partial [Tepidisphaeraceae bacterium]|nr:metallophosphoesterase [Tepidisphaeraceae bacterium]